eukprot:4240574-Amphidinium_carterae.1
MSVDDCKARLANLLRSSPLGRVLTILHQSQQTRMISRIIGSQGNGNRDLTSFVFKHGVSVIISGLGQQASIQVREVSFQGIVKEVKANDCCHMRQPPRKPSMASAVQSANQ